MKYLITERQFNLLERGSEDKRNKLVGRLIRSIFPRFNRKHSTEVEMDGGGRHIAYYDKSTDSPFFAKYYSNPRVLEIDEELYHFLSNSLGANQIIWVIDWFNKEFGQDAEAITF